VTDKKYSENLEQLLGQLDEASREYRRLREEIEHRLSSWRSYDRPETSPASQPPPARADEPEDPDGDA
jgi:hypothetical protein